MGIAFISYRRDDTQYPCGRLYSLLAREFGPHSIFKDVGSIPGAVDFHHAIVEALEHCQIMLVLIGPKWLTATDKSGNRRLDNPDDFVRVEIEEAIARQIPILPVLVDGALMPQEAELPSTIAALSMQNHQTLRPDPDFYVDGRRIVRVISRHMPLQETRVLTGANATTRFRQQTDALPYSMPRVLLGLVLGIPMLALALAAVGPLAMSRWAVLFVLILYEVLLLLVLFPSLLNTLQHGGQKWLSRIGLALLGHQRVNYRDMYNMYLLDQHHRFDTEGLRTQSPFTLELLHVYVGLDITPTMGTLSVRNPVRPQTEVKSTLDLRAGDIWTYLTDDRLTGHNFAIIGPPGCGKTTLLRHTLLTLLERKPPSGAVKKLGYLFPVLVFLRDIHALISTSSTLTLAQAIQKLYEEHTAQQLPITWIEQQLRAGHCLIMLDGLDEVPDEAAHKKIVTWVERQTHIYLDSRFIVTSRPTGYVDGSLSGFSKLEVMPFGVPQMRKYLFNWFVDDKLMSARQVNTGTRLEAVRDSEALMKQIQNSSSLVALASNPLLLTMMATVRKYHRTLSGSRVRLYEDMCDVLLESRQAAKGVAIPLTSKQSLLVLRPLAYNMMLESIERIDRARLLAQIGPMVSKISRTMQTEDFLKFIEYGTGLLVEVEIQQFGFAHRTFQEYLAAAYVSETKTPNVLVERIDQEWWHETIRMYCSMDDPTPILAACLMGRSPSPQRLALALQCRSDVMIDVEPAIADRLEEVFDKALDSPDVRLRAAAAEAQLAARMRW